MHDTDPEHVSFIVTIVTGIIVGLLSLLKLSKSTKGRAVMAEAVLKETPVSHAELIKCQMEVTEKLHKVIRKEIQGLKDEIRQDIQLLLKHITAK